MKFTRTITYAAAPLAALSLPVLVLAQNTDTSDFDYVTNSISVFGGLINTAITILYALALLLFVWGVINYFILGAGDEGKRETGRSYMLYAIIGLVAITAVWGIVNLVSSILGVDTNNSFGTTPKAPK